jgi:hypothetical protein
VHRRRTGLAAPLVLVVLTVAIAAGTALAFAR